MIKLLIKFITWIMTWISTPGSEPYWDALIATLEFDRQYIRSWFYWKNWKAMLRLMVILVAFCFVPLSVFYWLGYCIIKHGLKYTFLMIRILIVGYIFESEWILISWCGFILSFCLYPFDFLIFYIWFRYIPVRRKKYKKRIKNLFSPIFWVKWFFAKLKKIIFFFIDSFIYFYKLIRRWNFTISNILIPTIQYWWQITRPHYRHQLKIKKIKIKKYRRLGILAFKTYTFLIPIFFILEKIQKIRSIILYTKFIHRVNKKVIIYKIIKRLMSLLKYNMKCYCKILIMNFQIFYVKTKYYFIDFIISLITIWWDIVELYICWFLVPWKYNIAKLTDLMLAEIIQLREDSIVEFYVLLSYLKWDAWYIRYYTSEYRSSFRLQSRFTRTYAFVKSELRADENINTPCSWYGDKEILNELHMEDWLKWSKDPNVNYEWQDRKLGYMGGRDVSLKEWTDFFNKNDSFYKDKDGVMKPYYEGEGKIFFNSSQYPDFNYNLPENRKKREQEEEEKEQAQLAAQKWEMPGEAYARKRAKKLARKEKFWRFVYGGLQEFTEVCDRYYGLSFLWRTICFIFKILRFIYMTWRFFWKVVRFIIRTIYNIFHWTCHSIFVKIIDGICNLIYKILKWIFYKTIKFIKWLGSE